MHLTTIRKIITGANRLINNIGSSEELSADDMSISLEALNALVSSYSNNILNIYTTSPYYFQLTPGKSTYLLGPELDDAGLPTNADWLIERPMRIEKTNLLQGYTSQVREEPLDYDSFFVVRTYATYGNPSAPLLFVLNAANGEPIEIATSPELQDQEVVSILANTLVQPGVINVGAGIQGAALSPVQPEAVGAANEQVRAASPANDTLNAFWSFPAISTDFMFLDGTPEITPSTYGFTYNYRLRVGPDVQNCDNYYCEAMPTSDGYVWSVRRGQSIGDRPVNRIPEPIDTSLGFSPSTLTISMAMIDYRQFADIRLRGLQTQYPRYLYDNATYPCRTLTFWPVPDINYFVEIWLWQPLINWENIDLELDLPPGYERMLRFNLAVEIAPEFLKEIPQSVAKIAADSQMEIQRLNQTHPITERTGQLQARDNRFNSQPVFNWRSNR